MTSRAWWSLVVRGHARADRRHHARSVSAHGGQHDQPVSSGTIQLKGFRFDDVLLDRGGQRRQRHGGRRRGRPPMSSPCSSMGSDQRSGAEGPSRHRRPSPGLGCRVVGKKTPPWSTGPPARQIVAQALLAATSSPDPSPRNIDGQRDRICPDTWRRSGDSFRCRPDRPRPSGPYVALCRHRRRRSDQCDLAARSQQYLALLR